ncbi:MAG TPA: efflux RND transporter permease subunit [Planctomycetota bacterium]|jgi:CzcA family heavy metal efflux pump|nr:efflux RND transporter permease subunit [Planctomycetota bacterium]
MIRSVVGFSVRFRGVILALACATVGYGLSVASRTRLDIYPEFAQPQVDIQTEAPGFSPEQVEGLVTRPIENALQGSEDLEALRSQSVPGLSVVTAVFEEGTNLLQARQRVAERLAEAASEMPGGVRAPAMAPLTSATSTMLVVGLTSPKRSPMELRTFADWTLRPRLLAVPGVAKVNVFGGDVRQLQVRVLPDRLLAYGLGLADVVEAARKATGVRGGGFVENENQRIPLQTEGQASTAAALGEALVARRGEVPLRLSDVAEVLEGPAPRIGGATIQGDPGVVLIVSSQYGANTLEVTRAIEEALGEMGPAFAAEGIGLHPRLFRPATFIETAIRNVNGALLLGGVLVAAVLFLFLFNIRTALISLTAIPLSLLIAVLVLHHAGATLNTLTLGGLAIAIGEVVDDAIVDVENIFRRLRENRSHPAPRPPLRVILEASLEVRGAVVYATFVVALVFLPVLTMTGVQGRLFAPLGFAYLLAVLASLAVALTVTPALCAATLARGERAGAEPPLVRFLRGRYRRLLERVSRRPGLVFAAVGAVCACAAATLPAFGGSFLPAFREGHLIVHMAAAPGTSLEESLRLGRQVSLGLLGIPGVRSVSQFAGRSEKADDTWGPHASELNVDLDPSADAEHVEKELREVLASFPGLSVSVEPFLTERIEETISGEVAAVAVRIFGEDLGVLDARAEEIARLLGEIPGAVDLQVAAPPGAPRAVLRLRRDRLVPLGFRPVEVLEAIQVAGQGTTVAQVFEGNRVFDVAVTLHPACRRDPEGIGALPLRGETGAVVPLRELAEVGLDTGRYVVAHDGGRRLQTVTCNVEGRDLRSFVDEAKRRIAGELPFSPGVQTVFTGAAEAREQATRELLLHSALAGGGIVLLLSIAYGNARNLLLVLANLPLALVGGVLAAFFTGRELSIGSLVGFVTLFGITTRNSILLVSHYEHLVGVEGMEWGREAALRGASERLAPILMTALVTALGLLPIALRSGRPGQEIEGPMAIVILGGLASSTALNLLVLPSLALRFGRFGGSREGTP